jgi:Na+/proline symporter
VVDYLPAGLSGLVIAGVLSAAMGTHSSALNSLASATTHDFYAPLTGRNDERHLLVVGRWMTIFWAIILAFVALAFRRSGQPVVQLALSIASITYGGMLGTYILAGVAPRVRGRDAIAAILVTTLIMIVVVLVRPGPLARLAFPWYVPLGTGLALAIGWGSSLVTIGAGRAGQTGRAGES